MEKKFYEIGKSTKRIEVTISYRIIQLFSEGLYSSPNKAIEELVSNAFDADAQNVHVILPADYYANDATIAIIDDGDGMDYDDLTSHWIIGKSTKNRRTSKSNRPQIGKFGIGKLATYVLSNRLTHICKKDGKYYSTSMDYGAIPNSTDEGVYTGTNEKVSLPFHELTAAEAKTAVEKWTNGTKAGYKALKLFGSGAKGAWTVAIMSELKPDMMVNLKNGMLRWVLSTALPLRDDFKLYLNGQTITSSRRGKAYKSWILGKDLMPEEIEKPAPDDLTVSEDKSAVARYGFHQSQLGRVTGYLELYDDPLDTGKSSAIGRNNGFFIYVRDRLINEEDGHFGIGSNELSHGTFARFRAVLHIDKLDDDLRSSRETVRDSMAVEIVRNLLRALFNFARREWNKRDDEKSPAVKFSSALAASPYTLTHRPLLHLVKQALDGKFSPRFISYSKGLKGKEKASYLSSFETRIDNNESLIKNVEVVALDSEDPMAILDLDAGILRINSFHPFVGHFLDEYENAKSNLPLELLAMSEVLLEASLVQEGISDTTVRLIMSRRDELLRTLAKSATRKNALIVAQELLDAANNQNELEVQVVSAFNSMGFEASKISGKNNPDGVATASLGIGVTGTSRYKVSLEAKSKEEKDKKVQNNQVRVSTIARHRADHDCDHAIVVGQDFPAKGTALEKEIESDATQTNKTITVINISDLARLVRLRPLKRLGPMDIKGLFSCRMPEDCKKWIDSLETRKIVKIDYESILNAIWERQTKKSNESVEYGAIQVVLENKGIELSKDDIKKICKSMEGMITGYIICRENDTVELRQRPDIVLDNIRNESSKYPDNEVKFSFVKK